MPCTHNLTSPGSFSRITDLTFCLCPPVVSVSRDPENYKGYVLKVTQYIAFFFSCFQLSLIKIIVEVIIFCNLDGSAFHSISRKED